MKKKPLSELNDTANVSNRVTATYSSGYYDVLAYEKTPIDNVLGKNRKRIARYNNV